MRRLVAGLLLAVLAVLPAAGARAGRTVVLDSVKIAVDDKALTAREVAQLKQLQAQEYRQQYQGDELRQRLDNLDEELTQKLVEDLLLEAYAERANIEVSDKDIEERVDNILRRQPNLQELYSDEQLKSFVLKDVLRRRVLGREVDARVRVAPADVMAACRQQGQDNREVEVGHILIRDTDAAARQKLMDIRAQLENGADFESLASQYSQDPSVADNKGRLGFISRGQFVKAFEDAAFALKPGDISEPVQTRFGLHLIKVFSERSKGQVDCDHMDSVTRQLLENQVFAKRRQERLDDFLAQLRKHADIRVYDTP